MFWLNGNRMRLIIVGIVAAMVMGSGTAKADFTFGEPVNLGPYVNSSGWDAFPCVSVDGLELYFDSEREGGYGYSDIWVAFRQTKDDEWGIPENLGSIVNIDGRDEYGPAISGDGLELYFATWPYFVESGSADIFMTKRITKDDPWREPTKLDLTVPNGYILGPPSISADGLELYFAILSVEEAKGNLYVAKRKTKESTWGEPEDLGPVVNSWCCQVDQRISHDGLLLIICDWWACSPRPGGFGSDDMWYSKRATKEDEWQQPVNLGASINTPFSERSGMISTDGSTIYFFSDRPGWQGGDDAVYHEDIWQASIKPVVDLNGDGIVDSSDMCLIIDHWGEDYSLCDIGPMPWGDGIVDVQDLIVLAKHLFEQFPPAQ